MNHSSLWKHLKCDADTSHIKWAIVNGTMLVIHVCSYIKKVASTLCAGAVVIACLPFTININLQAPMVPKHHYANVMYIGFYFCSDSHFVIKNITD